MSPKFSAFSRGDRPSIDVRPYEYDEAFLQVLVNHAAEACGVAAPAVESDILDTSWTTFAAEGATVRAHMDNWFCALGFEGPTSAATALRDRVLEYLSGLPPGAFTPPRTEGAKQ